MKQNLYLNLYFVLLLIPSHHPHFTSSGDEDDPRFSRPHDLDLIQTTGHPMDLLDMKAPPRVLTLSEQPLDSLETEQTPSPQTHVSQGVGPYYSGLGFSCCSLVVFRLFLRCS